MAARAMVKALLLAASFCLAAGCAGTSSGQPVAGVPAPDWYVIEERQTGPIVVIFPGRSAPTDDVTLGIRETAIVISRKLDGSVALFTWQVMETVETWVVRQAGQRRENSQRARIALVGHSWGGEMASRFARQLLEEGVVDEVSVLVTIDAIQKGYAKAGAKVTVSALSLEGVFGHRLKAAAFHDAPRPDGRKLVRHVNYYQLDSPYLHGDAISTASENHEVWFDSGAELGHGNLDNFLVYIVAEDVCRAFLKPVPLGQAELQAQQKASAK